MPNVVDCARAALEADLLLSTIVLTPVDNDVQALAARDREPVLARFTLDAVALLRQVRDAYLHAGKAAAVAVIDELLNR